MRPVIVSEIAIKSLEQIYNYGVETFAYNTATLFIEELYQHISQLSTAFLLHPECQFVVTKNNSYRNLIHGNYMVIYRITAKKIEVLNVLNSSRSPTKIKASKKN
ncbi:MAG: type II toxin-antitoxin system RelE/ParE family toxin [Sphingobacteriales bacterium]|nr:MAG: type II toxin-antitoxin system RelE/ParE family toxin [Sphingobacteriales bacterium]